MPDPSNNNDLIQHLCNSTTLSVREVKALVDEILQYYNETLEQYVQRRHLELRGSGLGNNKIFTQIQQEARQRAFRETEISERQIRRIIYG